MRLAVMFGVAAAIVGGLVFMDATVSDPYENDIKEPTASMDVAIDVIQKGNFVETLDDGMYSLTISGEKLGQDEDVKCVMIKDDNITGHKAYAGLSCNF